MEPGPDTSDYLLMKEPIVRLAEEKDLPDIHALVRELAIFEKAESEFTASLETYRENLREGVFEVLVAEINGQVVGMCLYYLTFSTWKGKMLYLEDFVVREAFRRRGIGQKLWDQLQERAVDLGCQVLKWQVLDWNEPALSFYRKNKAIIEKEWWNGKLFFLQDKGVDQ
jgi:ribosomal protein S18 acetylase RimI-like enzyme